MSVWFMRIIRLFQILDILRGRNRPVTAQFLAEELCVTPRTIYRDMTTLNSIGAPIRGEAGIGYQIEPGFFLPPLYFDEDELDVLVLGLRMVSSRSDTATKSAAERVMGKLGAMNAGSRSDLERPLLAIGNQEKNRKLGNLSLLRSAIRARQYVQIDYLDLRDKPSLRTIRPLALTAFESVWLLTAWCEARSDFRDFRLDRISTAKLTGEIFRHVNGKRFHDYLKTL